MQERLLIFLKKTGINPSQFAQKIGFQRSSISHIISGRNKPSYDFLIKMIESFPMVNIEWLLTGNGNMFKSDVPGMQISVEKNSSQRDIGDKKKEIKDTDIQLFGQTEENESKQEFEFDQKRNKENDYKSKHNSEKKEIEKIIILYKDMTFNDYLPG